MKTVKGKLGESLNKTEHGDHGPFLVCATTTLPKGSTKDGFISSCIKCNASVHIPEKHMVTWRNTGASVVCTRCAGGTIGQVLDKIELDSER